VDRLVEISRVDVLLQAAQECFFVYRGPEEQIEDSFQDDRHRDHGADGDRVHTPVARCPTASNVVGKGLTLFAGRLGCKPAEVARRSQGHCSLLLRNDSAQPGRTTQLPRSQCVNFTTMGTARSEEKTLGSVSQYVKAGAERFDAIKLAYFVS